MSVKEYKVRMIPLNDAFKPMALVLDENELRDLTSAMNFGSGWFRYRDEGGKTIWLNTKGMASISVEPMEGGSR